MYNTKGVLSEDIATILQVWQNECSDLYHIPDRQNEMFDNGLRNFLFNMKYIMKFYRPLYVSIKITMRHHRLVDCQNKHKYSTSMFGDLH